ncbi:hypothetical protein ACOZCG_29255 [Streptomyces pseudogriseolus]|uniref:hypothetical protein n=1 Tax=Streptomyces pseudogriseolus TaxID=36817 RepID=UPI003FA2454F
MSGVPLPEPPNADADNGPLKPAHEAAYYLGMAETYRILTRPGEPARAGREGAEHGRAGGDGRRHLVPPR